MNQVIPVQSEYEQLLEEIRLLQARIVELTALRDDLVYHICPALRSEYEEKIASLERELLAAQMYLHEKQRIIEILQAQLNRQKTPSLEEAREKAHEEFEEYQEDLKKKAKEAEDFREHWEKNTRWSSYDRQEKADQQENCRDSQEQGQDGSGSSGTEDQESQKEKGSGTEEQEKKNAGSGEDFCQEDIGREKKKSPAEELKSLYRKVVKRLHPDVHPDPTEREKALLNEANEAYAKGDLEKMQKIWEEICGSDSPEDQFADTPEGIEKLKEMLQKLKKRLHALEEEITGIRSEFPYTMKSFLENEQAVRERRQALAEQLKKTRERDQELGEYIEELRKQMQKQMQW
ncbi:MAG: hypothetical protein IIY55_03520 [Blautia sp.]|nr:hypothetical protein [Blautia sp.]